MAKISPHKPPKIKPPFDLGNEEKGGLKWYNFRKDQNFANKNGTILIKDLKFLNKNGTISKNG